MGKKGTRVLIKRPPGKEVAPTDKFAFNKAFTSERMKFKINQIQQDLSVSHDDCTCANYRRRSRARQTSRSHSTACPSSKPPSSAS